VRDLEVVLPEQVHSRRVEVELVDQEHVRGYSLDGLGDVARLLVVRGGQVLGELTLLCPVERGVEGGEPDRGGRRSGGLRGGLGQDRRAREREAAGETGGDGREDSTRGGLRALT
jgi:hypothetical protein